MKDGEQQRTVKQNSSLHVGCRNLADEFKGAGLDMKKVLKPEVDTPWTEASVKEFMFNPISKVMFDGRTSSELDTKEIQAAWDLTTAPWVTSPL